MKIRASPGYGSDRVELLNQIARWANTYREAADALEMVKHLAAIERALGNADRRWGIATP